MKTHKIVKVEWNDSCNYRGWRSLDKIKEAQPATCVSCGILVKTKRGSIGVSHSLDDDNEIADTIIISRKTIRKMEVVGTFKV